MVVEVVGHVEFITFSVWVKHADLDHVRSFVLLSAHATANARPVVRKKLCPIIKKPACNIVKTHSSRFMVNAARRGNCLFDRCSPCAQHLADRPCLRDTSTGRERRIPVVNFTERSEAVAGDLFAYWVEKTFCRVAVSVDPDVGKHKRPDEPAPHRTLVIDAIALPCAAPVVSLIARLSLGQTAQSV